MSSIYLIIYLELTVAPQTYLCKVFLGLYTGLEQFSYCKYFEQIFRKCNRVGFNKVYLNTHLTGIHLSTFTEPKHILKFSSKNSFVLLDRRNKTNMNRISCYFYVELFIYGTLLDFVIVEVRLYQDYHRNCQGGVTSYLLGEG